MEHVIITTGLSILFIIQGLSALIYQDRDRMAVTLRQRYTEESVHKFIRIHGLVFTAGGIVCLAAPLIKKVMDGKIVLIVIFAALLYEAICVFTVLKKY